MLSAHDATREARPLGASWEGVVRSQGLGETSAMAVARRFLELWQASGRPWLDVDATHVSIAGHPVLEASASQGAWILPAYTTGVRCFRPAEGAQASQIRSFADELARLRPSVTTITRFRDWLWADGAEGMEIQMNAGFLEDGETEVLADAERWVADHPRATWFAPGEHGGALLSVGDLERSGAADAPAPPQVQPRSPGLRREAWHRLGAASNDGTTWGLAITTAFQSAAELRALMPPDRLARFLRELLADHPDIDLVLQLLASGPDARGQGFRSALDLPELGVTLARRTPGTPAGLDALVRLGRLAPPALLAGLARGLRERSIGGDHDWLAKAVTGIGLDRVLFLVHVEGLTLGEVLAWGAVLDRAGAPTAAFEPLLWGLSGPDALRFAATLEPPVVGALTPALRPALHNASTELAVPVLLKLCASQLPAAATLVGECLVQTRGADWPPRLVTAACASLGVHRLQRPLVALTRDSDADTSLRLRILHLLTDPDAVNAATTTTLWDYLEPAELKAARRALRQRANA